MQVTEISVRAYRIPTESPEEDGTFHWEATTLVPVEKHPENEYAPFVDGLTGKAGLLLGLGALAGSAWLL